MIKPENEVDSLPKLVGTNFVKLFREYILTLIKTEKLTENDVLKKAYLEKNVKPDTTRKYIGEMLLLEILVKEKEFLKVKV